MQDRVVIVTGGAAGIGKATARRFSDAGARVAVWDVREGEGGVGTFQQVDVTDAAAVEAATAEVFERWGRIDVLVNNAGITRDAQLVKWKEGRKTGEMRLESGLVPEAGELALAAALATVGAPPGERSGVSVME